MQAVAHRYSPAAPRLRRLSLNYTLILTHSLPLPPLLQVIGLHPTTQGPAALPLGPCSQTHNHYETACASRKTHLANQRRRLGHCLDDDGHEMDEDHAY
jgi:hypothetical protein